MLFALAAALALTSIAQDALARPGGICGRSGKQGDTCNKCHAPVGFTGFTGVTTPTVTITGPSRVLPSVPSDAGGAFLVLY